MKPKAAKFVYKDHRYTVTLEDGSVIECGEVVSHGKLRKIGEHEDHYDHVLKFSDGVTIPFVGSAEVVVIPDISWL